MKNSDDAHKLTDIIYENLSNNFNAGIRQIVITGKAYHKALAGVASAARTFHEALANVGTSARLCKGGTEQIGEAIQQIAEAQRDIQAKLDESTKILVTDVILPLEHKLDHDFKKATSEQRKYHHGHKTIWGPYSKAYESLKKFRKKSKNKIGHNEQKEEEYVMAVNKCQERLEQYRMQGLKLALLEERKWHCFLLEKLCAYASLHLVCHRQGCDALSPLPAWRQLCANPLTLPTSGEHLLSLSQAGPLNGSAGFSQENGYMYTTRSTHGPIHRSKSAAQFEPFRDGQFEMSKTLPERSMVMPPPPSGNPKMRAMYTHAGETEEQLGFTEGDVIALVGEKSEGWHYGQNLRSGRYGWFPLSFTEPFYNDVPPDLLQGSPKMTHRVRSMGDLLDSRSLSDQSFGGHDVPRIVHRPNSMFEETSLNLDSSVSQLQMNATCMDTAPHTAQQGVLYSHNKGQPVQDTPTCIPQIPPTPPLPPPPPPLSSAQSPQHHASPPLTSLSHSHIHSKTHTYPLSETPTDSLSLSHTRSQSKIPVTTSAFTRISPTRATGVTASAPPPPPLLPPLTPRSSAQPSSTRASKPSHTKLMNVSSSLQQHPPPSQAVMVPPGGSSTQYGNPARQPSHPPPPPPAPPGSQNHPPVDYGGVEEDVIFQSNPKFANVSLRKAVTNDRSAPKIK